MLKSIKTKFFATLCATVMTLGVVSPSFNNTVSAASAGEKTVYMDVEKNILGQAPILQPVKVTLTSDETGLTIAYATVKAALENNIDVRLNDDTTYVQAFSDTSDTQSEFANYYKFKDKIPKICFDTTTPYNQPIVTDPEYLSEKEYNGMSGWMFTVNNTDSYGDQKFYAGDTPLDEVPDGATIRWEFSAADGCDLGMSNYLPDGTVSYGYYNWKDTKDAPFFTGRADKTALIRAMANHSDKADAAYTNALTVLQTLESTKVQVDNAVNGL